MPFLFAAVLIASLLAGCEAGPAFEVPAGPPRAVDVDVVLPVDVPGAYRVNAFRESLGIELAKYRIRLVAPPAPPGTLRVRVDLGQFTYRDWQEIDVILVNPDGAQRPAGSVRIPDPGGFSVDAAAEPVAAIIAHNVWSLPQSPAPPAPHFRKPCSSPFPFTFTFTFTFGVPGLVLVLVTVDAHAHGFVAAQGSDEALPPAPDHICAIKLSPNSEHLISVAPSINRAKSYVTFLLAIAPFIPLMTRSAASFQPRCLSIISPLRTTDPGFTLSRSAYLGAVPWVASKTAWPVT